MLEIIFYLFVFLLGASIGSFLDCAIYRLETGEGFLSGRSYCPKCKHILSWQDLIPVLSFLVLKGKCRYCHQKISWQHPLVEISTALIFLLIFNFQFLISKQFLIFNFLNIIHYWLISCFLIMIFVYDLKHYIIPDKIIYPAIAIASIFNFQFLISNQFSISNFQISNFYSPILTAFVASIFFLAIVLISKGKWMGVGDIKLAFFMGLFLDFPKILVALFLAFFIGAIIGTSLVMLGKKTLKSEVPFGPFLVSGTFLSMFLGEQVITWYLNLF